MHEYRTKYPDKAVIYSDEGYDNYAWAVFIGGGSLAATPKVDNPQFLADASSMQGLELNTKGQYALGNPEKGYIVYSTAADALHLNLANAKGNFVVRWIDARSGRSIKEDGNISDGRGRICWFIIVYKA